MKLTKAQLEDLAKRAGHTFWQAFVAVIGVTWLASGLNVNQITDIASAKRFAVAALVAVGAAALSAAKSTVAALTKRPVVVPAAPVDGQAGYAGNELLIGLAAIVIIIAGIVYILNATGH